ncbi:hypothetical protein DFH28DRAFT_899627 [Melampsora americana]|nr:hypothetical protein DFH28DRAFT_899627 [Melampsora americana]
MAPNNKSQHQHQVDIKDDNLLQAILLADPFGAEQSWGPLVNQDDELDDHDNQNSTRSPWCLLPILGTPILIWTLDSISLGGVQQVFLFIRDGIDQVRAFLSTTSYLDSDSKMSVTIIPTTAYTPGDVLREVDSRALLKTKTGDGSDIRTFVLAQCGYIGNLDLSLASDRFAIRRKLDGNLPCLSTLVKSVSSASSSSQSIHLLTPTSRLLHFHMEKNKFPSPKRINISAELFQQPQDILLRADLQSIGIEICSVEVPQLFTENFDYQQIRPDFIHGILTSDLLGKTILCDIVKESQNLGSGTKWATLVDSVKSYDSASRDILARASHPLVLDSARPGGSPLTQRRGMIYIGKDVDLALDSKIGNLTCIESNSTIASKAQVEHSYVGRNVQIGPRTRIIDSYILDDVCIGSDTLIESSIIGSGVIIKSNCSIEKGCLIGTGVVMGDCEFLKAGNVSLENPQGSQKLKEEGSSGWVQPRAEDRNLHSTDNDNDRSDSEDENEGIDVRNYKYARLGATYRNCDLISPSQSTDSFSSVSSIASSSSSNGVENIDSIGEVGSTKDFLVECHHSLERAFREEHTVENASIELKTLRMASNVSQSQVRSVVITELCELVERSPNQLEKWSELIKNLLSGDEDLNGMEEVILELQTWVSKSKSVQQIKFFSKFLQHFYNSDVINEEGIMKWFKNPRSKEVGGIDGLKLREVGGKLLQMIMDSEEESD